MKAKLLCFLLEQTLKHNEGPYSCRISLRLGLCLQLSLARLLPYSYSTSLAHLPVIPGTIFLINHLYTNPHPQIGFWKIQPETEASP